MCAGGATERERESEVRCALSGDERAAYVRAGTDADADMWACAVSESCWSGVRICSSERCRVRVYEGREEKQRRGCDRLNNKLFTNRKRVLPASTASKKVE